MKVRITSLNFIFHKCIVPTLRQVMDMTGNQLHSLNGLHMYYENNMEYHLSSTTLSNLPAVFQANTTQPHCRGLHEANCWTDHRLTGPNLISESGWPPCMKLPPHNKLNIRGLGCPEVQHIYWQRQVHALEPQAHNHPECSFEMDEKDEKPNLE